MSTVGQLAIAHDNHPGAVVVDPTRRRYVKTSAAWTHVGTCAAAAYNPAGTRLAIGGTQTPRLKVYDTSDWSSVSGIPSYGTTVNAVAFNPAGTLLAVGWGTSPRLAILNTSDWTAVSGTPTLPGTCRSCAWSPDGTKLAVAALQSFEIYQVSDWTQLFTVTVTSNANSVAWSPDGSFLACAGSDTETPLRILNTTTLEFVSGVFLPAGGAMSVSFSPAGDKLAVAHTLGNFLTVMNTADWTDSLTGMALDATGWAVAYSQHDQLAVGSNGYPRARILDKTGATTLWDIEYISGAGRGLAWSPVAFAGDLSGNVQDAEENPVARQVIAIRDSTNEVVSVTTSDASTGNFAMPIASADGHTVLMRETSGKVRVLGGGIDPV